MVPAVKTPRPEEGEVSTSCMLGPSLTPLPCWEEAQLHGRAKWKCSS